MDWSGLVAAYSIPGYGILALMVLTLIKTWPIIQKNVLEARNVREGRYSSRISELEAAVIECRQECDDHKEELRSRINHLEEKRLGDRQQNLQEQISLVSVLVKYVPNPLLEQVLKSLESAKMRLPYELTGVTGDAGAHPNGTAGAP